MTGSAQVKSILDQVNPFHVSLKKEKKKKKGFDLANTTIPQCNHSQDGKYHTQEQKWEMRTQKRKEK